jgi:FMN phosphatase YigB (HAD superfamily)
MRDSARVMLLDIGGVVLVDPLAGIFDALAQASSRERDEITDYYSDELRESFWTGELSEPEFWSRLIQHAGVDGSPERWRTQLIEIMQPLPIASELNRLGERFRMSVLSNHRAEWLRPALERHGLSDLFQHVFISSETGLAKPDPAAYRYAVGQLGVSPEDAVMVDDKQGNLDAASSLGLQTLLADAEGAWIQRPLQMI